MGGLYIYVRLKVQFNLNIRFSASFYTTRYAEGVISTKKSCFLLFHGLLFLKNNTWELIESNSQSMTQVNGMKIVIMQVTYFLNSPMVNLMFYCYIILH